MKSPNDSAKQGVFFRLVPRQTGRLLLLLRDLEDLRKRTHGLSAPKLIEMVKKDPQLWLDVRQTIWTLSAVADNPEVIAAPDDGRPVLDRLATLEDRVAALEKAVAGLDSRTTGLRVFGGKC